MGQVWMSQRHTTQLQFGQRTAGRPQCHEKLRLSIRTNFKHLIRHRRLRFRLADSRLIFECVFKSQAEHQVAIRTCCLHIDFALDSCPAVTGI